MDETQFSFGIFTVVGYIMLVLSLTCFVFLRRVKNKSQASWHLLRFFLSVVFSSVATIFTNTGLYWERAISAFQDAFLILAGVFLVKFAYSYPRNDQPREARLIVTVFWIIAAGALGYATIFAVQYLTNIEADIDAVQAYYYLTPLTVLLTIFIFLRRANHFAPYRLRGAQQGEPSLSHMERFTAHVLRRYALALSFSLLPVVIIIINLPLPNIIVYFLFNFGVILALAAIMLVYLNHAPEATTLSAKLIGISLVTILLLIGLTSVWLIMDSPQVHDTAVKMVFMVVISSLAIFFLFPVFLRISLLKPIERLIDGVKEANANNLNVRVKITYEDEVGYLTDSFNRLIAALAEGNQAMRSQSDYLETKVVERTVELSKSNERLVREIMDRKTAEAVLDQQLLYQKGLSGCSQTLLLSAGDEETKQQVLSQALEYLRSGADASRAYIMHTFEEPEMGLCVGIIAEACANGIRPDIDNPVNQKFPTSYLPKAFVDNFLKGLPYGGVVEEIFDSTPELKKGLLEHPNPLLSMLMVPVFVNKQWWGLVGFDDCVQKREWKEWEMGILATASIMIANTIHRWNMEERLHQTLDKLEIRIKERTQELSQSNRDLLLEIQQRHLAQKDLENRLRIEEHLAAISTRLLHTENIRDHITASLEDLGRMMDFDNVFLIDFETRPESQVKSYLEWHQKNSQPMPAKNVLELINILQKLHNPHPPQKTLYIDKTTFPSNTNPITLLLSQLNVDSLILSPLMVNNRVQSILGCVTSHGALESPGSNLRELELVVDMLSSRKQREHLIQTLEEQVAERTHLFTTFLDMAVIRGQAQNLADIFQPILHSISQVVRCDVVMIHTFHEKMPWLDLVTQIGVPAEFIQSIREITFEPEFVSWIAHEDLFEITTGANHSSVFPNAFFIPGYRTFFANPIKSGSKILGILSCLRVESQSFTALQATLLTGIGDLLGIIFENYRLQVEAREFATIEERQRLAREIHDAVSQSVYSLSLFARSATDRLDEGDQDKLKSTLQDIETISLQAMREMRLLLYQLRESVQNEDIGSALYTRIKQVENRLGIEVIREIDPNIHIPPSDYSEVWRIVIEAMNNVIKHANASQVAVEMKCQGDYLFICIQDDGCGYDVEKETHGMGLKNIRARLDKLGGQLEIVSAIGQGTQVKFWIPLACTA